MKKCFKKKKTSKNNKKKKDFKNKLMSMKCVKEKVDKI